MPRPPPRSSSAYNKWKTRFYKAYLLHHTLQGDIAAGSELAYRTAVDWFTKNFPGGMPQRKSSRFKRKRKPQRRRRPQFMGVSRIPVRRIVPYSATSGSQHRWYYNVTLSLFSKMFQDDYQEFKITRLVIKYLPNNSTNETGLYSAVVLDRTGFGAYGTATASSWFTTIGAMPGAKVRARYVPSVYTWRPTEPSVRDWCNKSQEITYCTIYICNNGQETEELGGMLEISATLLARGLYYGAIVKAFARENPVMFPEHPCNASSSFECLKIEGDENQSSRPSSRASSLGAFRVIG